MRKDDIKNKLLRILIKMECLWGKVQKQHGIFKIYPHIQPDFMSIDDFIKTWEPVAEDHKRLESEIRADISEVKDLIDLSDMAIGFDVLRGHSYKYSAYNNNVECVRYKDARMLIDKIGCEIQKAINNG